MSLTPDELPYALAVVQHDITQAANYAETEIQHATGWLKIWRMDEAFGRRPGLAAEPAIADRVERHLIAALEELFELRRLRAAEAAEEEAES